MADQAVLYILLRVQEEWPQAVLFDLTRREVIPGRSFTSLRGVTCCRIYQNTDDLLGSRLFHTLFPALEVTRLEQAVKITGRLEAQHLAREIARLPFWRHRVSDRLEAQ